MTITIGILAAIGVYLMLASLVGQWLRGASPNIKSGVPTWLPAGTGHPAHQLELVTLTLECGHRIIAGPAAGYRRFRRCPSCGAGPR